jgi:hypothetical protein
LCVFSILGQYILRLDSSPAVVPIGQTFRLTCTINPPATYGIYWDNHGISVTEVRIGGGSCDIQIQDDPRHIYDCGDNTGAEFHLTIPAVTSDDHGTRFSCQAGWPLFVFPSRSVVLFVEGMYILETNIIEFTCPSVHFTCFRSADNNLVKSYIIQWLATRTNRQL